MATWATLGGPPYDEVDEPLPFSASPSATLRMDSSFRLDHARARASSDRPPRSRQASRGYDYSDTEFNRKYAPDPYGDEAADNARVWQVYFDESSEHDRLLLDGWNKTLDILLIFAGLFSAVSTALIIESYRGLQPDYQAYTAGLLFAVLTSRNSSGDFVLPDPAILKPPDSLVISDSTRWINGLWFTSLVLSLSVALLSILAKQWLDEYLSRIYAPFQSARYWARRRAMYFGGLTSWHLPAFISTLPVLLHVSLFLFFGGLVLFLLMLDSAIAYSTLAMSSLLLTFYVTTLLLPFWKVDCPTRTPLIGQLPRLWDRATRLWRWSLASAVLFVMRTTERHAERLQLLRERVTTWVTHLTAPRKRFSMDDRERDIVYAREADLDATALQWLLTSSAAQEVVAVGVQAIGALSPRSGTLEILRTSEMQQLVKDHINANVHVAKQRSSVTPAPMFRSERDLIRYSRYLRTWLALNPDRNVYTADVHLIPYVTRHPPVSYFDLGLLQFILRWTQDHQNMVFFSLLKKGKAAFLPSTVIQGMGVIVRSTSNVHDRKTQALSAVLHLFHAGRLAEAQEHDLLLAVDPVRELLSHLGVHVHTPVDTLSESHSRIVAVCVKLWSSVLNQSSRLNLDKDDVSVAAQDLGKLVVRLEQQSDTLSLRSSTHGHTEDFSAFVMFVASPAFVTHRWDLHVLSAMSQLIKNAALGLASTEVARSLAHLAHCFTQRLVEEDEDDAITRALEEFTDNVAWIFTATAYPSLNAHADIEQHGYDDPMHPVIPQFGQNLLHGTMLYFLQRQEDGMSAWRVLHTAGWPAGSRLIVADTLAANLCALRRRGIDVRTLCEEFFSVDFVTKEFMSRFQRLDEQMPDGYYDYNFGSLLSLPQSQVEYFSANIDFSSEKPAESLVSSVHRTLPSEIERLAQHCGELDAEWWNDACERILESLDGETEGRLREFVLHLVQLGGEGCLTCQKATQG